MMASIGAEQCSCPPDRCAHYADPDSCVHRLPGDVRTASCERCGAYTWHQDGDCLRCQAIGNRPGNLDTSGA